MIFYTVCRLLKRKPSCGTAFCDRKRRQILPKNLLRDIRDIKSQGPQNSVKIRRKCRTVNIPSVFKTIREIRMYKRTNFLLIFKDVKCHFLQWERT